MKAQIPILINHKRSLEHTIGWVCAFQDKYIIDMTEEHALSEAQIFDTFGNIGYMILEKLADGRIKKFEITHFSLEK